MRDEILKVIADLEERETYYMNEIERIEQTSPMNMTQYKAFEDELRGTREKIQANRNKLAELEGAGVTAQEAVFSQFEQLTFGDTTLTLREMCENETYYQLLSGWIQQYVGDLAEKHAAVVSSYKSQTEALNEQVVELDKYRRESIELAEKLADMEQRRNAAGAELLDAKEEINRLNADNESLRMQLEGVNKTGPTNLNTNLAELAKQIQAAKPGIYNKRWKDENRKTHYLAELSATGETIEIPYLEIGTYREETAEEAEKFRADEAARIAEENAVQESALVDGSNLTVPELPSQGNVDGLGVGERTSSVAGEAVSREEFDALAGEVERIKQEIAAYTGRGAA